MRVLFAWRAGFVWALVTLFYPLGAIGDAHPLLLVHSAGGASPTVWTMDDLRALPAQVIETTTPFTDGQQRFDGVPLRSVLGDVAQGDVVTLVAVNEYAVTIPVAEITETVPIIAFERNGSPMSVREKGPLWIIYPFDDDVAYQNELTYSRSIWQLVEVWVGQGM